MSEDSIKVAVRVRPKNKTELKRDNSDYWAVDGNQIVPLFPGNDSYSFDYAFDTEKLNSDVYEIVRPIVQSATEGFHATVFAYGQTSSGKTHTIMGEDDDPGIIPRCVDDLFSRVENNVTRKFIIRASYIEIHNEKLNDLLNKEAKDLKIREDITGTISVTCTEKVTTTRQELLTLVITGNKYKQIGETKMNEKSSRSHVILKIIIESSEIISQMEEANMPVQVSHLFIVDLAGSERPAQTKATGLRLIEGGHINKSLSVLSLVIKQLSESQEHISFRDSKLTRILSNALGGNSKTMIIATVTPVSLEDSQSTLQFARCARNIKNQPHVNEILTEATLIKQHQRKESRLTYELQQEKEKNQSLQIDQSLKDKKIQSLEQQLLNIQKDFVKARPRQPSRLPVRRHTVAFERCGSLTPIFEGSTNESEEFEVFTTNDGGRPTTPDATESLETSNSCTPREVLKLRLQSLDTSHTELKEFYAAELSTNIQEKTEEMANEIESLKKQLEMKDIRCAELEVLRDVLAKQSQLREQELLSVIHDIKRENENLTAIEQVCLDDVKISAHALEIQVARLEEESTKLRTKNKSLEEERQALQLLISNQINNRSDIRRAVSDSSLICTKRKTLDLSCSRDNLITEMKQDIDSLKTLITLQPADDSAAGDTPHRPINPPEEGINLGESRCNDIRRRFEELLHCQKIAHNDELERQIKDLTSIEESKKNNLQRELDELQCQYEKELTKFEIFRTLCNSNENEMYELSEYNEMLVKIVTDERDCLLAQNKELEGRIQDFTSKCNVKEESNSSDTKQQLEDLQCQYKMLLTEFGTLQMVSSSNEKKLHETNETLMKNVRDLVEEKNVLTAQHEELQAKMKKTLAEFMDRVSSRSEQPIFDYDWETRNTLLQTIVLQKTEIHNHVDKIDELESLIVQERDIKQKLQTKYAQSNLKMNEQSLEITKLLESVDMLNRKLESSNEEVRDLKHLIASTVEEINTKKDAINTLKEKYDQAIVDHNRDIDNFAAQKQDLFEDNEIKTRRVLELERKWDEISQELKTALESQDTLTKTVTSLKAHMCTISDTKLINEKLNATIADLQSQLIDQKTCLDIIDDLQRSRVTLLGVTRHVEAHEEQLEAVIEDIESRVNLSNLTDWREVLDKLKAKVTRLETEFACLWKRLERIPLKRERISHEESRKRELRRQSDPFRIRRSLAHDQHRHLEDLNILCDGCLQLTQEMRELCQKNAELNRAAAISEGTITELKEENHSLDAEILGALERINDLKKMINIKNQGDENKDRFETKCTQECVENIKRFEAELTLKNQECASLRHEIAICDGCSQLTQEMRELSQKNAELNRAAAISEGTITELKEENHSLDAEVLGALERINDLKKMINIKNQGDENKDRFETKCTQECVENIKRFEAELTLKNQECASLRHEIASNDGIMAVLKEENRSLDDEVVGSLEKLKELRKEIASMKVKDVQNSETINNLSRQLSELQSQRSLELSQKNRKIERLLVKTNQLQYNVDSLLIKHGESSADVKQRDKIIEKLRQTIAKLKEENFVLDEKVKFGDENINELRSAISSPKQNEVQNKLIAIEDLSKAKERLEKADHCIVQADNLRAKYIALKELAGARLIKLQELAAVLAKQGYTVTHLESLRPIKLYKLDTPVGVKEIHLNPPYVVAASISEKQAAVRRRIADPQPTVSTISSTASLSEQMRNLKLEYKISDVADSSPKSSYPQSDKPS